MGLANKIALPRLSVIIAQRVWESTETALPKAGKTVGNGKLESETEGPLRRKKARMGDFDLSMRPGTILDREPGMRKIGVFNPREGIQLGPGKVLRRSLGAHLGPRRDPRPLAGHCHGRIF